VFGVHGNRIEPGHRGTAREQQQHIAANLAFLFVQYGDRIAVGQQMAEAAAGQAVRRKALLFDNQQGWNIVQSGVAQHGGVNR